MDQVEQYDLVILGSGEGSKYLAWTMARTGQKIAVIERQYVGGSCPNIACLPTKNVIHSAKVADLLRRSANFGTQVNSFSTDMTAVRLRKREMVNSLVEMHVDNYAKSGAELIMGIGRFTSSKVIHVQLNSGGTRQISGHNLVIGTGTRSAMPQITGLSDARPLTHIEALELDQVPQHLLILGGGYIGLEFAQAMRRFGSRVTVVERNRRLLSREDEDISEGIQPFWLGGTIPGILYAKGYPALDSGSFCTLSVARRSARNRCIVVV